MLRSGSRGMTYRLPTHAHAETPMRGEGGKGGRREGGEEPYRLLRILFPTVLLSTSPLPLRAQFVTAAGNWPPAGRPITLVQFHRLPVTSEALIQPGRPSRRTRGHVTGMSAIAVSLRLAKSSSVPHSTGVDPSSICADTSSVEI